MIDITIGGDHDGAGNAGFHVGSAASFLAVESPVVHNENLLERCPVLGGDFRHWTPILRMNRLSDRFRKQKLRGPPLIAFLSVSTLLEDLRERAVGRSSLQEQLYRLSEILSGVVRGITTAHNVQGNRPRHVRVAFVPHLDGMLDPNSQGVHLPSRCSIIAQNVRGNASASMEREHTVLLTTGRR